MKISSKTLYTLQFLSALAIKERRGPVQLREIATEYGIPFKAGAEISSTGMVVAVIDPIRPALLDARSRSLAEARRDNAAARMERARAQQQFAASELRRNEKLYAEKTVSTQELEQVQWRETSASRELTAAEAALREAEAELVEFTNLAGTNRPPVELRAPVCGRVLKVIEQSSRTITAGLPLVEIGDPTDLEAGANRCAVS